MSATVAAEKKKKKKVHWYASTSLRHLCEDGSYAEGKTGEHPSEVPRTVYSFSQLKVSFAKEALPLFLLLFSRDLLFVRVGRRTKTYN